MFNAFGKLWLKGARRLAKAQVAQQKKLQKSLQKSVQKSVQRGLTRSLAPAVKKQSPAVKRTGAAPAKSAAVRKRGTKIVAGPGAPPGTPATGGSWTRSYHTSAKTGGRTGARRLTYWLYLPDLASSPVADELRSASSTGSGLDMTAPATAMKSARQPGRTQAGMPLVIMLHGCDQTAPDFAAGTRMNRLAARHGFAVLYPQQSLSAHAQRCWPWYKRTLQQGGDEIALIAGMVEKVVARHSLDSRRIYVAGISAGAAMAQILALRRPDLIAAVALHSGPVYGLADSRVRAFSVMQHGGRDATAPIAHLLLQEPDFPPMPALIVQGEQDHVVRSVNAGQLVQQFCTLNRMTSSTHAAPVTKAARGACDAFRTTDYQQGGKTMVRLCEVTHLAHAWSGGDAGLRYNTAAGPDASALAWNFFKGRRRLPGWRPAE